MPYSGEFSKFSVLKSISNDKDLLSQLKGFKFKNPKVDKLDVAELSKKVNKFNYSVDRVLAFDGSFFNFNLENSYPNNELGIVRVSSSNIDLVGLRSLKDKVVPPSIVNKSISSLFVDILIPGSNLIFEHHEEPLETFREIFYEALSLSGVFNGHESLLETYEQLKLYRSDMVSSCPDFDCKDAENKMINGCGKYECLCENKNTLYSTDALRFHEIYKDMSLNTSIYSQVMLLLEKLLLINTLRYYEKTDLSFLKNTAFIMDGTLAVYGPASWISKSIFNEVKRISAKLKDQFGSDLLIFGLEKTGNFVEHLNYIQDFVNSGEIVALSNNYIKENIVLAKGNKNYGEETYFGRKFFYKTLKNNLFVVNSIFINDEQKNLEDVDLNNFTRVYDIIGVLEELQSTEFKNGCVPISYAHENASISSNLITQRIIKKFISDEMLKC